MRARRASLDPSAVHRDSAARTAAAAADSIQAAAGNTLAAAVGRASWCPVSLPVEIVVPPSGWRPQMAMRGAALGWLVSLCRLHRVARPRTVPAQEPLHA